MVLVVKQRVHNGFWRRPTCEVESCAVQLVGRKQRESDVELERRVRSRHRRERNVNVYGSESVGGQ